MTELITVPTFTFKQGDLFKGDNEVERPIVVEYYNGSITISQDGDYDQAESITIHPKFLKGLFKEIIKHQPEAEHFLKK